MNIVFMGTPEFSVPVLERLIADEYTILAVVTQPDRPKGRKQVVTPPPVKVTAMAHEIPVLQPKHLKVADDEVLRLKPDLIVTAAYGQMLPSSILEAPRYGCINVHASLLPKYRGGAPIHHAIIDGKNTTGVTIMYMVERMDAGDIVTQIEVPIEETDHVGTMHDKLSEAGANLLSETIPLLIENKLTPQKQVEEEVTFSPNITRNDERIDWSQTGEEIYNRIRGLHPWPVAYTYYEQKPFKVWWGIKQPTDSKASPGTVIAIENDGILIATGNTTAIKITDCQPAGRRRMSAAQFMAGSAIQIGDKFGEEND